MTRHTRWLLMAAAVLMWIASAGCEEVDTNGPNIGQTGGTGGTPIGGGEGGGGGDPSCIEVNGACVQCAEDADCEEGVCHPTTLVCVQCVEDNDCKGGVCDPASNECVECLADDQCPDGSCNTDTNGCVGGCTDDSKCDDGDPCTKDECTASGECVYEPIGDPALGCGPDPCPPGTKPDAAGNCVCPDGTPPNPAGGCEELCPDGSKPDANGNCPCDPATDPDCGCKPIECGDDQVPADEDGDGCDDTCVCADGTQPNPFGGCGSTGICKPLPAEVDFGPCEALIGYLYTGDGCEGISGCDCGDYCDYFFTSLDACEAECGACDPTVDPNCGEPCPDGSKPDANGNCPCDPATDPDCGGCPFFECPEGQYPIDKDGDGCFDTCVCDNGQPPTAAGGCGGSNVCEPLPEEPFGPCDAIVGWVYGKDGCFLASGCGCGDLCDLVYDSLEACEEACGGNGCDPIACPEGSVGVDENGDGCIDSCVCPDGTYPDPLTGGCGGGPNECKAIDPTSFGECLAIVGVVFDGKSCVTASGCGCGDLCDYVFESTEACEAACGLCDPSDPDCGPTCEPIGCPPGSDAYDSDGDGCLDTCVCPDGQVPGPFGCEGACDFAIDCAPGYYPVDTDGDGCDDECVCESPDPATGECNIACPAIAILCPEGAVPADLDGDGCDDGCICEDGSVPTADGCGGGPNECVAIDPNQFGACEMLMGAAWNGEECVWVSGCGCDASQKACEYLYEDLAACNKACGGGCDFAIDCAPGYVPVDTDGDGCDDECVCVDPDPATGNCVPCEPVVCPQGAFPADLDQDGCPDTCVCNDGGVPPNGFCCPVEIFCAPGTVPVDENGDGCADACVCENGQEPDPNGNCGGCETLVCPNGSKAVDTNNDGCPDECWCDNGDPAGANGCGGCEEEIVCIATMTPIDTDGDGCDDTCGCLDGSLPGPNGWCECPTDFLTCPPGQYPADLGQGVCECVCDNGTYPGPDGQCGCTSTIACAWPTTPADTDGDGCEDACLCEGGVQPDDQGNCPCIGAAGDVTWCADNEVPQWSANGTCECVCAFPDPDGQCGCQPLYCPEGSFPVDADQDGCDDTCYCENGAQPDPFYGCPKCPPGSYEDPATGECVSVSCDTACDCYEAGIEFAAPCPLLCPNCGNFWACEEKTCVGYCGMIPDEVQQCFDPTNPGGAP